MLHKLESADHKRVYRIVVHDVLKLGVAPSLGSGSWGSQRFWRINGVVFGGDERVNEVALDAANTDEDP